MTAAERRTAERQIRDRLAGFVLDRRAVWVLGYIALADEVRIDEALTTLAERGVDVWLPRVLAGRLCVGRWRPTTVLTRDEEGVWAPADATHAWPPGRGVLLVPGRGFDASGGRVGRGRGYYDRLLSGSSKEVIAIGVAYGRQMVERVPREPHDHDMAAVVTESRTFVAPPGRVRYERDEAVTGSGRGARREENDEPERR